MRGAPAGLTTDQRDDPGFGNAGLDLFDTKRSEFLSQVTRGIVDPVIQLGVLVKVTAPLRCLDLQFTERLNVMHLLLQNCPPRLTAYEMAQPSEGRAFVSNAICGSHLS